MDLSKLASIELYEALKACDSRGQCPAAQHLFLRAEDIHLHDELFDATAAAFANQKGHGDWLAGNVLQDILVTRCVEGVFSGAWEEKSLQLIRTEYDEQRLDSLLLVLGAMQRSQCKIDGFVDMLTALSEDRALSMDTRIEVASILGRAHTSDLTQIREWIDGVDPELKSLGMIALLYVLRETRFKDERAIVLANTLVRDESNEFRAGLADNIGKFADEETCRWVVRVAEDRALDSMGLWRWILSERKSLARRCGDYGIEVDL